MPGRPLVLCESTKTVRGHPIMGSYNSHGKASSRHTKIEKVGCPRPSFVPLPNLGKIWSLGRGGGLGEKFEKNRLVATLQWGLAIPIGKRVTGTHRDGIRRVGAPSHRWYFAKFEHNSAYREGGWNCPLMPKL